MKLVGEERDVDMNYLCGFIVHRLFYSKDKLTADIGKQMMNGNLHVKCQVTNDHALYIMTHGRGMGKMNYRY